MNSDEWNGNLPTEPEHNSGASIDSGNPGHPRGFTPRDHSPPQPQIPNYELLRRIGKGGYGEVWLARDVIGRYRAVKIVYRDAFDSERPYEREFNGIKKFEPISRSHPSQVDVLHVGRTDELGYFFYVMELADHAEAHCSSGDSEGDGLETEKTRSSRGGKTASGSSGLAMVASPETYRPKTLESEIKRRGRLPYDECLQIAYSLTTALQHLHENGLVHRDIKPANVIFTNNVPKLADIGLVAETEGSLTFVGTEGYLPPEGPGKPNADIYSLGKTLYVMCTGKDRFEFPAMPTEIDGLPERRELFEFNEVLLKACHPEARRRYRTAGEMLQDLNLLRASKSVRRKQKWKRSLAVLKKAASVAAVLSVIGFGGFYVHNRNETVVVPKVTPIEIENAEIGGRGSFDFSSDGRRIVLAKGGGHIWNDHLRLWDETTALTRRVPLQSEKGWRVQKPRWSPDDREIMAIAWREVGPLGDFEKDRYAFLLVDPESGEAQQVGPELRRSEQPRQFCWRPDGSGITYRDRSQNIYTLTLAGGRSLWVDWDTERRGIGIGDYSPDGQWLALTATMPAADRGERRDLWIVRHLGGRAVRVTDTPGRSSYPIWAPDGKSIYFVETLGQGASSNIMKIQVDPAGGRAVSQPEQVTFDYSTRHVRPQFVTGQVTRLAYGIVTTKNRIMLAPDGQFESKKVVAQGVNPQLSPDGRRVYYAGQRHDQHGIWMIKSNGEEPRQITTQLPHWSDFALSPDESTIAYSAVDGGEHSLFTVPTQGGGPKRLLNLKVRNRDALPAWSPDSQWLAYADDDTIYAMRKDGTDRHPLAHLWRWQGWTLKWSPKGTHIAAFGYESPEEKQAGGLSAFWISFPEGKQGCLHPRSETNYKEGLEWHPDGDRLTYMYYGPEDYGAQIRWAYLDGRTELWFDQEGHWDWVGKWAPDGERFYFLSFGKECQGLHLYHPATGKIEHGLEYMEVLPRWSRNGETMAWVEKRVTERFQLVEDYR